MTKVKEIVAIITMLALVAIAIGLVGASVADRLSANNQQPPVAAPAAERLTVEVVWPDVVIEARPGDIEPYVFQVGDHTCVAYQGALECFCACETCVEVECQEFGCEDCPVTQCGGGEEPDDDGQSELPTRPDTPNKPPDDDDGDNGDDGDDGNDGPDDPGGGDDEDGDQDDSGGDDEDDGNEPPHEHKHCNQGRGNGKEGCDPGNSNNNHDSNDEGDNNRGGNPTPNNDKDNDGGGGGGGKGPDGDGPPGQNKDNNAGGKGKGGGKSCYFLTDGPVDDIANGLLLGLLAFGVAFVLICILVVIAVNILR